MGNTPCAHAVDSVLHQRVEIKVNNSRSDWVILRFLTGRKRPEAAIPLLT